MFIRYSTLQAMNKSADQAIKKLECSASLNDSSKLMKNLEQLALALVGKDKEIAELSKKNYTSQ